ncbi:MAG: ABC transporter substrate-binding protein [Anaerolineae bacterium]
MNVQYFFRKAWRVAVWGCCALFVFSLVPPAAFAQSADSAVNLTDGCVETYDPAVDYFPDKVQIDYASTFQVEYHANYKVITVTTPWQGADQGFTYVLVQCGTPAPEGYEGAEVINVPIQSIVTMSTTYLPHLVSLGVLDTLVGVDETDFIYSPDVLARIAEDNVIEVGGSNLVNVEQVLNLDPDLVMTYGLGSPDYDAHPVLLQAGIPVALNADYVETNPLGRAEWLKFTAMFYNRESIANTVFDQVAQDYEALRETAAAVENRPTVMVNGLFQDTWYVSGGGSYLAQLIADAGGEYLWSDDNSVGALPLSLESVLDRAQNADVWLNPNFWFSLSDGLAEDERYAEFAPFQNGTVYNNNARVTDFGGNDYTEGGVLRPDLVLADLIAILHPDLMPDHALYYFRHLE